MTLPSTVRWAEFPFRKLQADVFNILLQVLDDGKLTDNKGRTASFKNTIIIMTSNIGSDIIQERFENMNESNKLETIESTKNEVFNLLKKSVRPEFLNRIDETIMFTPLTKNDITSIVRMQFNRLAKRLEAMDIQIDITENAVDELARLGYNPQFGARPVKRIIQKELLNELSKKLLSGEVVKDSKILVDVVNGEAGQSQGRDQFRAPFRL